MILSGTETIYREELVNANYDGQNYQLNIRAQDMPRGGSGNLAQERMNVMCLNYHEGGNCAIQSVP